MVQKKALMLPQEETRQWIDPKHPDLSVTRQCAMIDLPRSSYYRDPIRIENEENLRLMREIDELYLKRPFFGSPRMTDWLKKLGWHVNEKRVARLMRLMGLQAVVPGPHTSRPHPEHRIYPYLLRNLVIDTPGQVWCSDITYVPMRQGFLYLVAIMDWYSRYVLAWELSNSLETDFCVEALDRALKEYIPPGICNTDQGSQFTSDAFVKRVESAGTCVSMDGRGRASDNIFIERLWWSVKYEEIYLYDYLDGTHARKRLDSYFRFYNTERSHSSLGNRTPQDVYQCKVA